MDDWDRMRREAERRVRQSREMQTQKVSQPSPEPQKHRTPPTRRRGLFDLLDLNKFSLDGDRSMVLMMLALLSGEEKDDLLTLALLYILL